MKNGVLYIIGNGFDLYHGLKTGVCDFKKKLKQKSIYNQSFDALTVFEGYGVNWGEYENSLSDIDLNNIDELNLTSPDYLSDRESDRDRTIFYMEEHVDSLSKSVLESLDEMIGEANNSLYNSQSFLKKVFQNGDAILSFNYTSTIEELYDLPDNVNILHLHGLYDNKDKLIFGYKSEKQSEYYEEESFSSKALQKIKNEITTIERNNKMSFKDKKERILPLEDAYNDLTAERDFYIDRQREIILEFHKNMKKELKLKELEDFLGENKNVNEIRVFGHSMSEVDYEYMELIEKIINPKDWYISQYDESPNIDNLKKYSFNSKVNFFIMNGMENYKKTVVKSGVIDLKSC